MKTKILLLAIIVIAPLFLQGQDVIDNLIDKYEGKKGFVVLNMNGNLFKLISAFDDDEDVEYLANNLQSMRIIALDDDYYYSDINFYDEVMKEIDQSSYLELMTIREVDQKVIIWAKKGDSGRLKEILLLAGGDDDNAVISIKGDIDLKTISTLSTGNTGAFSYFADVDFD